jgi:hypothetical protein
MEKSSRVSIEFEPAIDTSPHYFLAWLRTTIVLPPRLAVSTPPARESNENRWKSERGSGRPHILNLSGL